MLNDFFSLCESCAETATNVTISSRFSLTFAPLEFKLAFYKLFSLKHKVSLAQNKVLNTE